MNHNEIWLVADRRAANVRAMEHEGDYADGDTLIHVSNGIGGVNVRLLPVKDQEDTPRLPARDGDKLIAWLREGADELEHAHRILDEAGVPRSLPGVEDVECTLAARIALALPGGHIEVSFNLENPALCGWHAQARKEHVEALPHDCPYSRYHASSTTWSTRERARIEWFAHELAEREHDGGPLLFTAEGGVQMATFKRQLINERTER